MRRALFHTRPWCGHCKAGDVRVVLVQHVQDQSAKCRTSFADDGADMGPTREQARRQPTHVLFASVSRLVNSICSFCSGSWYVRAVVSLRQGQCGEGRLHAGAPTGLPCCSTSCRGLEWQHSPFAMHRVDTAPVPIHRQHVRRARLPDVEADFAW